MAMRYQPKSAYEKFGLKIYSALVKDFPRTYFVGGMVRDFLLHRKIADIDIATSARPDQVADVLRGQGIKTADAHSRYGIITALAGRGRVEITTFRQDLPAKNRYPKVRLVDSPREDSRRRDFTVNALYYDWRHGKIFDFHGGRNDLQKRQLKFIGVPARRIAEDPLRLIRALRFELQLNFDLKTKTAAAIKKYFHLTKKLTRTKMEAEISKLHDAKQEKALWKIINSYLLTPKKQVL